MKIGREDRHIVDFVFVIVIFLFFALSSLTLIISGAGIFQRIVNHTEHNFNTRTSFAYVTEKIRQCDSVNSLQIVTVEDTNALVLEETIENTLYRTYIYQYEGQLMELFTTADSNLGPESGRKIMPIKDFYIEIVNDNIMQVRVTDNNGEELIIYVTSRAY